jgi:hypothetical protein
MVHPASSAAIIKAYTCADIAACIQLWSLHKQCHQMRGWVIVYLLYLLAGALQYLYLNYLFVAPCFYLVVYDKLKSTQKACHEYYSMFYVLTTEGLGATALKAASDSTQFFIILEQSSTLAVACSVQGVCG